MKRRHLQWENGIGALFCIHFVLSLDTVSFSMVPGETSRVANAPCLQKSLLPIVWGWRDTFNSRVLRCECKEYPCEEGEAAKIWIIKNYFSSHKLGLHLRNTYPIPWTVKAMFSAGLARLKRTDSLNVMLSLQDLISLENKP